ncbi:MAG: thiamine phosphate synthase [Methylobacteriaceae bacterium]|jgi:thiamine-phosphate pyrophosphorylase|nr:thiamine phosphate synthase [Methylobacteriaceae bacterium]
MAQGDSPRLYLIAPAVDEWGDFLAMLEEACAAGDVASLLVTLPPVDARARVNFVKAAAAVVQKYGTALLARYPDTEELIRQAFRGGADGIHVMGGGDTLLAVRGQIGNDAILGAGGLKSRDDAMWAGERGADYVMFGEPHADGFVPPLSQIRERVAWWCEIFNIPCVAYAPDQTALEALADAGAEFLAVDEPVWKHPRGAGAAVGELNDILKNYRVAE